jgi:hypothetical protein
MNENITEHIHSVLPNNATEIEKTKTLNNEVLIVEEVHLNDIWSYYFHDPNDDNWSLTSYIRMHNVSTVQDFWNIHLSVKDKLKNGMFFIMREHVFPCWDDSSNINGGCLSIKVLKENLVDYWEALCIKLLGETLLVDKNKNQWDVINGISTSPKRYFCIVKIWLSTNEFDDKKYFNVPDDFYGDIIYRQNIENIQKNNETDNVTENIGDKHKH